MKIRIHKSNHGGREVYEIIGDKHAMNGNDMMYGTADTLDEAIEKARYRFEGDDGLILDYARKQGADLIMNFEKRGDE